MAQGPRSRRRLSRALSLVGAALLFSCAADKVADPPSPTSGHHGRAGQVSSPAIARARRDTPAVDPRLDPALAQGLKESPRTPVRVLLTYAAPPTEKEAEALTALGAQVLRRWDRCAFVILARLSPEQAAEILARDADVVAAELDQGGSGSMMNAMRHMGTRAVTGGAVGGLTLSGQGQVIAVMDSGVDDTHPDLAGRVVGWMDFAGPDGASPGTYLSPIDRFGHGTGVSSVAVGGGLGSTVEGYAMTASQRFPQNEGSGDTISFPIRAVERPARIGVTLDPLEGQGGVHGINLLDEGRARLAQERSADDPMQVTFSGLEGLEGLDSFNFAVSFFASSTDEIATGGTPYEAQIAIPFDPLDERPLTLGASPGASLFVLKVLGDDGEFPSAEPILDALTWLHDNSAEVGITVINASLNFTRGGPNVAVDDAVNRLVEDTGIPFVASARNGQATDVPVASPATARRAIAVGAINHHDQVTAYSSVGRQSEPLIKPDLLAPGGSNDVGRIVTADSNSANCKSFSDDDCIFEEDSFRDDYRTFTGTSFAAPHVAGVIALLLEAEGGLQRGSIDQHLRLKALLAMTATEVQAGEAASPGPPGRAGAPKDHVEGFGRINTIAAVEALTQPWPEGEASAQDTLGGGYEQRRAWARRIGLEEGEALGMRMEGPEGGDFDLYLYSAAPSNDGEPVILDAAVRSGAGMAEEIFFVPSRALEAIVVVKRISGEGQFSLERQPAEDICLARDRELIGAACTLGEGLCAVEGSFACSESREAIVCEAGVVEAGVELCGTGQDEDCDGVVDEGFRLLGAPCLVGLGACAARGAHVCAEGGLETACSAEAGRPVEERCGDGRDDDCDGIVDEGFEDLGEPCEVGVGACENRSVLICAPDRLGMVCPVEALPSGEERCGDGRDDDCDGIVDEGFEDLGEPCGVGAGACASEGVLVCDLAGEALTCGAEVDPACEIAAKPVKEGCATISGRSGVALWWLGLAALAIWRRRSRIISK